jgi:zinc D-Ala-D-Ala carboxypeptidase
MISEHISFEEATQSQSATRAGIKNMPGVVEITNMKLVAEKCFEPLRKAIAAPIRISSFFRCKELNSLIGGAFNSQHVDGKAIDIQATGKITNLDLFNWLKDNVDFDQLILEFPDKQGNPAWVHVSYNEKGNRKEVLRAKSVNGKTIYEKL